MSLVLMYCIVALSARDFCKRFNVGLHIRRMDALYNRLFINDRETVKENDKKSRY